MLWVHLWQTFRLSDSPKLRVEPIEWLYSLHRQAPLILLAPASPDRSLAQLQAPRPLLLPAFLLLYRALQLVPPALCGACIQADLQPAYPDRDPGWESLHQPLCQGGPHANPPGPAVQTGRRHPLLRDMGFESMCAEGRRPGVQVRWWQGVRTDGAIPSDATNARHQTEVISNYQ